MSRYFNSIKVRLEHYSFLNKWMEAKFQFHKGAIRTLCLLLRYLIFPYFNSIKVRLEPTLFAELQELFLFQFHKGAIRTHDEVMAQTQQTFQFHKGAIRTR